MSPQRRISLTCAHAALPAALSLSQTHRECGSERAVPCRSETGAAARCGGLRGERLGLGGQAAAAGAAQPGHGTKGCPRRTRGREQLSPGKAHLQKQAPGASAQAPSAPAPELRSLYCVCGNGGGLVGNRGPRAVPVPGF